MLFSSAPLLDVDLQSFAAGRGPLSSKTKGIKRCQLQQNGFFWGGGRLFFIILFKVSLKLSIKLKFKYIPQRPLCCFFFFFLLVFVGYFPSNCVFFLCCCRFPVKGWGCGLISVYCNMSTNHWLPPSVCAVTSGGVQDFPSFLKDAGEQLEQNSARDWDFLASQTLSAQTCAKWKQTQPRLLITIRLDLCPLLSSDRERERDGKMADCAWRCRNGSRRPAPSGRQPLLAGIMQVDAPVAPVIFQSYYFLRGVIYYAGDNRLVSSGPCGLNLRQILCH